MLNRSKILPEKAIKIPAIFFEETCSPKIIMPATIAKIGVSAFKAPASALSIFVQPGKIKKMEKDFLIYPTEKRSQFC